ncbi:MAG TPA: hypothetical protein VGQ44_04540 [Gemmatimonadaceae bacterium]|jgi:hypothetical protein|nr:hypothetical protein [Gemmatimonadaceae bacterium]
MRTSFVVFAVAAITAGACTHSSSGPAAPSRPVDSFGTLNGAHIELTAEGGIAALSTSWRANHDDRSFVYARRHVCGTSCPAPMDSASGAFTPAAADSLFSVVWSLAPMNLHDDYGTTHNAADMFQYTLRITFDGATKTVRADDGTMPDAMRQIVVILGATIDSARAHGKT